LCTLQGHVTGLFVLYNIIVLQFIDVAPEQVDDLAKKTAALVLNLRWNNNQMLDCLEIENLKQEKTII
jgi:hypothetical protein